METKVKRVAKDTWQPIETAPRDGTLVLVTWLEDDGQPSEIHPMQWGHITRNEFFAPGQVGMWVAPHGGYTWQEGDGGGPTHWQPATPPHKDQ